MRQFLWPLWSLQVESGAAHHSCVQVELLGLTRSLVSEESLFFFVVRSSLCHKYYHPLRFPALQVFELDVAWGSSGKSSFRKTGVERISEGVGKPGRNQNLAVRLFPEVRGDHTAGSDLSVPSSVRFVLARESHRGGALTEQRNGTGGQLSVCPS